MFEFFDFITNLIGSIINLISYAVVTIVEFIKHIAAGVSFVNLTVAALPPFCRGAIGMIFGIALLTLVLGVVLDY